jgi:hypothetical protein
MKFSEAFFSTEKIIYPCVFSFLFGAFILIIASIFNKQIGDGELMIFMCIGFIIGNHLKSNKLIALAEKEEQEAAEKEKKQKRKKNK